MGRYSSRRTSKPSTPRQPDPKLTCPTCKQPGALTTYEAAKGYQCRDCTARTEGYGF